MSNCLKDKYSVSAIICAAGKGQRAGFAKNKLLLSFDGSTVLEKTISAFDFPSIHEIIVTASETDFQEISALCSAYPRTRVVLGGNDSYIAMCHKCWVRGIREHRKIKLHGQN